MGNFPQAVILAAQSAQAKWKIPASISLAQWAIESAWGKHMPPGSNNPFGMKVRAGRNDPYVEVPTREVLHGKSVMVKAKFRKFATMGEAFDAHGELLATAPVYAKAFAKLPDREKFIAAFAPIYATDPNYATLLRSIISHGNLTQYD